MRIVRDPRNAVRQNPRVQRFFDEWFEAPETSESARYSNLLAEPEWEDVDAPFDEPEWLYD